LKNINTKNLHKKHHNLNDYRFMLYPLYHRTLALMQEKK